MFYLPETFGAVSSLPVVAVRCGNGNVSTTPADVPIQSRSLQASNAVTRKHAVLCCRMISSQPNIAHIDTHQLSLAALVERTHSPDKIFETAGATFTSSSHSKVVA